MTDPGYQIPGHQVTSNDGERFAVSEHIGPRERKPFFDSHYDVKNVPFLNRRIRGQASKLEIRPPCRYLAG